MKTLKTLTTRTAGQRTTQQQKGQAGEEAALAFLLERGLVLVERNLRFKAGEIDLVMRDGATLVFVEVRRRASRRFGGAAASVTAAKQQRLVLAAQLYLQRLGRAPACRFDVLAIDGDRLDWLRNVIVA